MSPRIPRAIYPALRLNSFQQDPGTVLTAAIDTEVCKSDAFPWAPPDQKGLQGPFPSSALG